MSKILYEVYQNDIKDSESAMYGKWYARLKSIETLSTTKLAKHISEHGSVYTQDVVEGVMVKFKTCLLEMLLESKKVKIAGLGTFYLTAECHKGGADKEADFNVNQHLKALHIRFLPDQTAEDNIKVTVVAMAALTVARSRAARATAAQALRRARRAVAHRTAAQRP